MRESLFFCLRSIFSGLILAALHVILIAIMVENRGLKTYGVGKSENSSIASKRELSPLYGVRKAG